ncbi:cobalt transporter CbiM [Clostridium sp. DL1XJH146]
MHIPDNYLSPSTCATFGVVMIPIWRNALKKIKNEFTKKRLPLLGISSAFSFLIMMFNIPLPGGTTGHAVGSALIAILLGPYAALISTTIALVIQAFFFGDGGILALGANCFNMAFIMPFTAYYIYKLITENFKSKKIEAFAVFFSAYIALAIGALFTGIEFGLQPLLFKDALGNPLYCPYGLNISIPAMLIPHLLVACVLEGSITLAVYQFIKKSSPEFFEEKISKPIKYGYGLIIGLIALVPLGLLATGTAWGEWGTEEFSSLIGFTPTGMENGFTFKALMPDYSIHGIPEILAYILSAILGVFLIALSIKLLIKPKSKSSLQ